MSRRYKIELIEIIKDLGYLFYLIMLGIACIIMGIIRVILFFINMAIFYRSGYKKKTGKGYFKTVFDKGSYGEYLLYRKIIKVIDKENVVLNMYLPSESQRVEDTELDIVAISNKNIYCFEMKNYTGKIYGFRDQYRWSEYIRRKEYTFYNPLRQNEGHVKALEKHLFVEKDNIVPVVVFSNKADITKVSAAGVLRLKEVKAYLMECEERNRDRYGEAQIDKYIQKLNEAADVSSDTIRNHIADVRELKR